MQASGWTAKCRPASAAVAGGNIWLHGRMSAADNVLQTPEEDHREPKGVSVFKVLFKTKGSLQICLKIPFSKMTILLNF